MKITNISTIPNPYIFVLYSEFGKIENVTVADKNPDQALYAEITQCCSVMSVIWLKSQKTSFKGLSEQEQVALVSILLDNDTPEKQLEWGKSQINGDICDIMNMSSVLVDAKILIFNKGHITAAIKQANGKFLQFEPENGETTSYELSEFVQIFEEAQIIVSR